MKGLLSMILAVLVMMFVAAPAANAGQPVTVPLNPPPPSWETCKTIGAGFICEGSLEVTDGPSDTGIVCGSGVNTFDPISQDVETLHATRNYDTNGDLVKRVLHGSSVGTLTNPLTGTSVSTHSNNINTDVLAIPGDLGSLSETTTGNQNITVPGMGNIWQDAGRLVFADADLTDLTFESGHHAAIDYYYLGHTSVAQELCAALGA